MYLQASMTCIQRYLKEVLHQLHNCNLFHSQHPNAQQGVLDLLLNIHPLSSYPV